MAKTSNKKLKLIVNNTQQTDKSKDCLSDCNNCFFTKCPRKLDYYPDLPCLLGKPQFTNKGNILKEPDCEWWINSAEDNYCFWSYIKRNSFTDGTMKPLKQSEIAKLFGCSSTKIYFILKEAVDKLKESEHLPLLAKFYEELDEQEVQDQTTYHPDIFTESSDLLSEIDPED